jgi:hypothetical protein
MDAIYRSAAAGEAVDLAESTAVETEWDR